MKIIDLPGFIAALQAQLSAAGVTGDLQSVKVTAVGVGDHVSFFRPITGTITAIAPINADLVNVSVRIFGGPNKGNVETHVTPRTVAVQDAYQFSVVKLVSKLPYRSWWRSGDGSVWYARQDGLLYCDTPGSVHEAGEISIRGELEPLTAA